jgi:hypothetical protein
MMKKFQEQFLNEYDITIKYSEHSSHLMSYFNKIKKRKIPHKNKNNPGHK